MSLTLQLLPLCKIYSGFVGQGRRDNDLGRHWNPAAGNFIQLPVRLRFQQVLISSISSHSDNQDPQEFCSQYYALICIFRRGMCAHGTLQQKCHVHRALGISKNLSSGAAKSQPRLQVTQAVQRVSCSSTSPTQLCHFCHGISCRG